MTNSSKQLLPKYEITDNVLSNLSDFIESTTDKLFILSIGSCNSVANEGYYTTVLKYNNKINILNDFVKTNSANVCILKGIIEAVKLIKRPCNVYIVSSTPLGFSSKSSPNRSLCILIQQMLQDKGCYAELIEVKGQGEQLSNYIAKIANKHN